MIHLLTDWFAQAQGWLFQALIEPAMFQAGLADFLDDAFEGTEWLLIGLCELVLIFLVLRPLEALVPVHPLADRRARWNDFLYTLLHRLGLFPVLVFFTIDPLMDGVAGWLRLENVRPFNLENLLPDMVRCSASPSISSCWTSSITGTTAPSTGWAGGGAC